MNRKNNINLLRKKFKGSFSKSIIKSISLVSFNKNSKPIGSFAYKSQRYPGDIDINEDIIGCCSLKEAIKKLSNMLREFAFELSQMSSYYLADFKAGINYDFYLSIDKDIGVKIDKLYNSQLLSKNDYLKMMNALKNNNIDEFKELLRDKFTIRWTLQELLRGYKILPGNKRKNLEDAIQDKLIIKLDTWAPINGRYIEVTNFIVLYYTDKNGKKHILSGERPDYISGVKDDVKLYFSKNNLNVFKATKRLWLLANEYKDIKMLEKINKLISSDAGIIYQVISDMKTLVDLLSKFSNLDYDFIFNEIDDFRNRLSYVYSVKFNEHYVDKKIKQIVNEIHSKIEIISILEDLLDHLLIRLNEYTLSYDIKNGIFPVKGKYL